MKALKAAEEFVVDKNSIGYVDTRFKSNFGTLEFTAKAAPIFQKLPRSMSDAAIESELKPGFCELGDILAFIQNAPQECKDRYANIFYTPAFVVNVYWRPGRGAWSVRAWQRDDRAWYGGHRVFSPATESSGTVSSDTLSLKTLDARLNKIEQWIKNGLD